MTGSKGARTPDLSRVRRTLIPAELCFRLLIKFILPLYQQESRLNYIFSYTFFSGFVCLVWRSVVSAEGEQVSISFSMSSFLT